MEISQAAAQTSPPPAQFLDAALVKRVWSRWEHGNVPIRIWKRPDGPRIYELGNLDAPASYFSSARKLISAITGKTSTVPSFTSYFRTSLRGETGAAALVGPHVEGEAPTVFTFFGPDGGKVIADGIPGGRFALRKSRVAHEEVAETPLTSKSLQFRQTEVPASPEFAEIEARPGILREPIQEEKSEELPEELLNVEVRPALHPLVQELDAKLWSFQVERDPGLIEGLEPWLTVKGIKLDGVGRYAKNLALEVRKLLHANFWGLMVSQSYDPEEVLQEVYKGILTRNNGKCPWDPRKATFGYYVHMVIRGVLINYHRKQGRRLDRMPETLEVLEMRTVPSVEGGTDAMAYGGLHDYLAARAPSRPEGPLAVEILPYVSQGMTRREIVSRTGHKETQIAKALSHLRRVSREWAVEVGVTVR